LANEDIDLDSSDFQLTCSIVEYFVAKDKPTRAPRPRRSRRTEDTPPASTQETTAESEASSEETTEESVAEPRRRGWPKGKPRGPRKSHVEATTLSGAPLPQGGGDGTATQAEF
jgi:hypothetical protein